MPLYFHLQNGTEMIRDEEGIEVSDLDAARAEALDSLRDVRDEEDSDLHDWAGWKLAVFDEAGALLFSLDIDAPHLSA
jgi:hypothetical protein